MQVIEVGGLPHVRFWQRAFDQHHTGEIDWVGFFANYKAGVDAPVATFYPELMAAFPDAKVILTVRDADKWFGVSQAK